LKQNIWDSWCICLGTEVKQSSCGIFISKEKYLVEISKEKYLVEISKEKYLVEILKKFTMEDCHLNQLILQLRVAPS
jgi:hypothetical protein